MKTFKELREAKQKNSEVVFDKKMEGIPVKIVKGKKGFTVHIDGDRLDTFKTQSEAEKTAKAVVKEL